MVEPMKGVRWRVAVSWSPQWCGAQRCGRVAGSPAEGEAGQALAARLLRRRHLLRYFRRPASPFHAGHQPRQPRLRHAASRRNCGVPRQRAQQLSRDAVQRTLTRLRSTQQVAIRCVQSAGERPSRRVRIVAGGASRLGVALVRSAQKQCSDYSYGDANYKRYAICGYSEACGVNG
jgi:hypothetical protein